MRDVELRLIHELMKNSRRSDRELVKAIHSSQPIVARIRNKLEKKGYIQEYTMIPNLLKLGFHIAAVSFVGLTEHLDTEILAAAREFGQKMAEKAFPEVIVAERGSGIAYQGVFVSLHKDYASLVAFVDNLRQMPLLGQPDIESFLTNLDDRIHYRPLTFSTLAQFILTLKEEDEERRNEP